MTNFLSVSNQFDKCASFSTCVISALTSLKHVKKSERKFFFMLRCFLFCQKVRLVSTSAHTKFEMWQKSRISRKIAFNFELETHNFLQKISRCFSKSFLLAYQRLKNFVVEIYSSQCNRCLILEHEFTKSL